MSSKAACNAMGKGGKPCGGFAIGPNGLCFVHDPAMAAKRIAAQQRGRTRQAIRAEDRAPPPDVRTLETFTDCIRFLSAVAAKLIHEKIDPKVGTAIASVMGVMARYMELRDNADKPQETASQLAEHLDDDLRRLFAMPVDYRPTDGGNGHVADGNGQRLAG